ncbi:uncharacterized protein [Montipora capricornis]|uniref:uncharacterized protein n=1 Tax=Montipora capricornis TaxID=246305 RepID=UPI0035F1F9D7
MAATVLNKIIVVIRVISDVIKRDLFSPINLLTEPGLIFYVVLKSQHWCRDPALSDQNVRRASKTEVSTRFVQRGHCTQEFKKADRLLTLEPLNTAELKALQDRLTSRGSDISQMDSQIAMAISKEELENEIEDALSVQDTISDYKFMIMEASKNDQHDKPVSSFHDNNSSMKPTTTRINVNLPKLSIQPFNGNQLEWLTFWDSFSAAIDEHTELNNIEKMNYLQNMLKGEAARAIAGLPLTNENYTKAIEILKERFGDKQNIINAYMESLTRATPPKDEISSLRIFYDSYEKTFVVWRPST